MSNDGQDGVAAKVYRFFYDGLGQSLNGGNSHDPNNLVILADIPSPLWVSEDPASTKLAFSFYADAALPADVVYNMGGTTLHDVWGEIMANSEGKGGSLSPAFQAAKDAWPSRTDYSLQPMPPNFLSASAPYSKFSFSEESVTLDSKSFWATATQTGTVSVLGGLIKIRTSVTEQVQYTKVSEETTDVVITGELMRVSIMQPWWNAALLQDQGWAMVNQKKHGISTGELSTKNTGIMPFLPHSLLFVRNFSITASWQEEDVTTISAAITGSGSVSLGPITLSGSVEIGPYKDKTYHGNHQGMTFSTDPGVPQIIGMMGSITPACAPRDG